MRKGENIQETIKEASVELGARWSWSGRPSQNWQGFIHHVNDLVTVLRTVEAIKGFNLGMTEKIKIFWYKLKFREGARAESSLKYANSGPPRGRCQDGVRSALFTECMHVKHNKEKELEYPERGFRLQQKPEICERKCKKENWAGTASHC